MADDDIITRFARRVAEMLPKQDDLQKAQNDARVQQARIATEQFAAPKLMAMKQNIAQNVPGAEAAATAILKASRPAATDVGDIDEPKVRQPVQMSREFPSNPAGMVDQDEYIRKVREALKNAKQ